MYRCDQKIYDKNNNITHYVISDGQQQWTYPASDVKQALLTGKISISNLTFSKDGRLIDKKDDDILDEYYRSCQLFGIEPLKIEKMGNDYIVVSIPNNVTEITIPPFVTGFKIYHRRNQGEKVQYSLATQKATFNYDDSIVQGKLDELNGKVEKLIYATGYGFKTIDDRLEDLEKQIEENSEQFFEMSEKIAKMGGFTWKEFGTTRLKQFPIDYNDSNFAKIYTNKGLYKKADKFSEVCMTETDGAITIQPDDNTTHELYRHITAVNDIRICMIDNYNKIMNSERANNLQGLETTLLSSVVGSSMAIACAVNPALTIGAGVSAALGLGKTAVNTGFGGKEELKGEFLTWKKRHDVFGNRNGYISVDKNAVTDDRAKEPKAYAADIQIFVIDTMAAGYRRGVRDKNQVDTKYKNRSYYKFVQHTISRCPVDDERLFNFYCQFYLSRVRGMNDTDINYDEAFDDTHYRTEAGMKSLKAYTDCFVNAFFTSKKYLGYAGLDFLYDITKTLTDEEKKKYIEFLYYVKYCLVIQGMSLDFADSLIEKYIVYDLGYSKERVRSYVKSLNLHK